LKNKGRVNNGSAFDICYIHGLLTGGEFLTYSYYIFTEFDNRRIK